MSSICSPGLTLVIDLMRPHLCVEPIDNLLSEWLWDPIHRIESRVHSRVSQRVIFTVARRGRMHVALNLLSSVSRQPAHVIAAFPHALALLSEGTPQARLHRKASH